MKRFPYMSWFPADYLADRCCSRLTLQEHGALLVLLWNMWIESDDQCTFPLDYVALGAIWRVSPEEAQRILDSLLTPGMSSLKVRKRSNGRRLYSQLLHGQHERAVQKSASQSEKGKRSAAVRREKSANRGSTTVQPRLNHSELEEEQDAESGDTPTHCVSSGAQTRGDIGIVATEWERLTGTTAPGTPLLALCADHPTERILEAIRQSATAGKVNVSYTTGIARRLAAEGWKPDMIPTPVPNAYRGLCGEA